tara:strand:- start:215 stop:904 length:690 start_codon:yes stop_codon:yes gene_type:complete
MALQFPNTPNFQDRTLEDFKAKLIGGGARPNLFEVEMGFPSFATDNSGNDLPVGDVNELSRFMIKAAQLPASTISPIEIPFRGRNLKVAGDRTFAPWTITVINDNDFTLRTSFEKWMNAINKHDDNSGLINPAQYQKDAIVRQFGRASLANAKSNVSNPTQTVGQQMPVLKAYRFFGIFPTSISEIEVSYDATDQIEEFTVELQVQWWDALDSQGTSQLSTAETDTQLS